MVREIDLDMDWPYQVALPDESGAMAESWAVCQRMDLALRAQGPTVRYQGRTWAVYCFDAYHDAETFRRIRGGRWVHAHLWRSR